MSSIATPPPAPAESDTIARLATGALGGPRGRYAVSPLSRASRLLLAGFLCLGASLAVLLGFLQKSYCLRYGWGAPQVYFKACYSDLPAYAGTIPPSGGLPYASGSALSEPLGTGVALRLLAAFVPSDGFARQQGMFVAWAIAAAVLLVLTTVVTLATCRAHPAWAAHVALSPIIVTAALVSVDLVGVALTSVALWLWSSRRPTAAGVVLGLAITTRTYPVLVLVVLGVLALRAGVMRQWARTAGVAIVTTVLLLGVVAVFLPGVLTPYLAWLGASAQLGSPWYLATLAAKPVPLGVLTLAAMIGWVLAVGVGALVALAAPARPRIGEVAIVVVVLVLVTGKSLPPQSSLWLIPLVALAGLPWRDHLVWAATEICYFVAVWLYLGGLDDVTAALPASWYGVFLVLRVGGLLWLAAAATRQAMTRAPHSALDAALGREDDDAAGPMHARRDAVVVRYER
ncbi:glycosyltransferase family 87 protein [Mobilicoccus sp.]|uniref:glycosyltransferase family 87 protein n=1 Tax=Mobilicoccus sp. TaxID=2034349 RepID=UPI0028AA492B|nr:glycosyltransferase family 87 protein [Mobilicoccus sp.]